MPSIISITDAICSTLADVSEIAPWQPNRPAYRSVDTTLSDSARERIERAPSDNTKRAYLRWARTWDEWCDDVDRCPLPATAETLAEFVSHLADEDYGVPSIRMAISAVRFLHATAGFEDEPGLTKAKLALRTHSRERADRPEGAPRTRQATPILLDTLRAMIDACPANTLRGRRDKFLFTLGWSGMMRRSELSALNVGDVTESADGLSVFIARSKTDRDAKGAIIRIPRGSNPKSDPVALWREWLAALAERGITSGRLLRSVELGDRIGDDLTGAGINEAVKDAVAKAEIPNADGYSAHSLRAGGATMAYRKGATVSTIAEHGRWAKNSPVVLGYIRAVDQWKDNPMHGIGL